MSFATIGLTVPNFVVGPVLSLIFAVILRWVSAGGWGNGGIRDIALPVSHSRYRNSRSSRASPAEA